MARAQKSAFSRKKKEIPVFEKVAAPYFFSAKHDAILLYRNACFPEKCHFFSCCIVSSTAAHFVVAQYLGNGGVDGCHRPPNPTQPHPPSGNTDQNEGVGFFCSSFSFDESCPPMVGWLHGCMLQRGLTEKEEKRAMQCNYS